MREILKFQPTDRVLVVAPHPDDESIATGGLIQSALAAGAGVRVIVLTDGDANVWPQRWIEKRWRIDAVARARWGARRREEARNAMRVLGLGDEAERFLGLPDLGLTDLLMRADAAVLSDLRASIAAFAPNWIVLPSMADLHPDHSAANLLVRLALDGADAQHPILLEFAVHGGGADAAVQCELTPEMQEIKRTAILAHATQMRLSSKRFLRHAGASEAFQETAASSPSLRNPLRAQADDRGRLRVELDARQAQRGLSLFIVMDGGEPSRRLLVRWKSGAAHLQVFDAMQGKSAGVAHIEHAGNRVSVTLESGAAGWRLGFVKLARPSPGLWVFDRHGWQVIARS